MHKFGAFLLISLVAVTACSKKDPVLPGDRTAIFASNDIVVTNTDVPNLSDDIAIAIPQNCPYTQDSSNVIWDGDKKVFSGFPTSNSVKSSQKPICSGNYIYAGLTTGEVVKINRQTRNVEWVADVYRTSNMTGGASVTDIVAPLVIRGGYIYAGGIGDAFCKIQRSNGTKQWCVYVGTGVGFIVDNHVAFMVGTDNNLYAINTNNGNIYWRTPVKAQKSPVYKDKIITVGKEQFNAENGELIKR